MRKEKTAKTEGEVIKGLEKFVEEVKSGKIHTVVAVGLHNDGDEVKQFILGLDGFQFQTIGAIEIVKRDILNQVPEIKKGEL